MLSTSEAASELGISTRRVVQLVKSGALESKMVAGVWLIDEGSVQARKAEVNRKGGRPKRGHGKTESRFALMNRTHVVADLVYNSDFGAFSWIGNLSDVDRAPVGVLGGGIPDLAAFNGWWRSKGIPGQRDGLQAILADAGVLVPEELIMRNLGLSLSDQYWLCPDGSGLRWEDINFFNNPFDDIDLGRGCDGSEAGYAHPDNTSDGNLRKHWAIRDGMRVLLKAGGPTGQEPFNEVVATRLYDRLLTKDDYVAYWLDRYESRPCCACANFLNDDEEFIPAYYVRSLGASKRSTGAYLEYLEGCTLLNATNIEGFLWKMMVCDDILANSDRHFRNFGLIRNVETLEVRAAPIFDSGSCLWFDAPLGSLMRHEFSFESKQFYASPAKQMLLVDDFSWLDAAALEGFAAEAIEILQGSHLPEERLAYVAEGIDRRIERMLRIAEFN